MVKAISRSPLRKFKYSGHALWVGNLPSRVAITALKDYFSQGFDREIESLFLIAKSNCAFVNYRTEAGCANAIQKFHNSRFQSAQLVCRLRKSSRSGSHSSAKSLDMDGAALFPATSSSQSQSGAGEDGEAVEDEDNVEVLDSPKPENILESLSLEDPQTPQRYFVMKSLTIQDMIQSVRSGTWATQRHNEEALNNAFKVGSHGSLAFCSLTRV